MRELVVRDVIYALEDDPIVYSTTRDSGSVYTKAYLRGPDGRMELLWEERTTPPANQFKNIDFASGLDAILSLLDEYDPRATKEFREAYASELWYGKPTYANRLD